VDANTLLSEIFVGQIFAVFFKKKNREIKLRKIPSCFC